MKNIHVLPTDKSSKLGLHRDLKLHLHDNSLTKNSPHFLPQYVYITSEEEIKLENWIFNTFFGVIKSEADGAAKSWEKIVLTNDPELIADGVQDISDEFLEWFVKNPGCEEVEVRNIKTIPALQLGSENGHLMYKIITKYTDRKDELKQVLLEVMNLGMSLRQNQLSGHSSESGNDVLDNWIDENGELLKTFI
jgi:hypothetical protein